MKFWENDYVLHVMNDAVIEKLKNEPGGFQEDARYDMTHLRNLANQVLDERAGGISPKERRNLLDWFHGFWHFDEREDAEEEDREWLSKHPQKRLRVRAPHAHEAFTAFKHQSAYQSLALVRRDERTADDCYEVVVLTISKGYPLNLWDDVSLEQAFARTNTAAIVC